LAGFAIAHKAIAIGTQTPMAAWCVHTLMLTCIPLFTFINIYKHKMGNYWWAIFWKSCNASVSNM